MKSHPNLNKLIALIGALILTGLPLARADENKKADEKKIQLMFVQTAEDLKADGNTLRLVNVNQQTLYFSDRPVRVAGHLTMPTYMDEWKAGERPNNFTNDPPNATLSIYEPGRNDNTLTVVKISHPVIDGKDLVYQYKLIEGTMPKAGGATALFIDWIGVGGGVGPGFHGIGAGGYWYRQITGDSGSGAVLGPFDAERVGRRCAAAKGWTVWGESGLK